MPLLQLLVDGLQLGALYALMAVGFAIIFGSTRVFHYAHGTTCVIVGYLFYYMTERAHVPWWLAAALAACAGVVFGVALDRYVYRPIQRDEGSFFTVFVASFGIGVVAENLVIIFFGASFVSISTPLTRANDIGGGVVISWLGIASMLVAIALFAFLNWFLARTDVGVALRALSENPELVRGFGLNPRKLSQYAFAIGSPLVAPAAAVATCDPRPGGWLRPQPAKPLAIRLRDRLAAGRAGRAGRDLRHRPHPDRRPPCRAHLDRRQHHRRHRLIAWRRPRRPHPRSRREPRGVEALHRLERGGRVHHPVLLHPRAALRAVRHAGEGVRWSATSSTCSSWSRSAASSPAVSTSSSAMRASTRWRMRPSSASRPIAAR